MSHEVEGTGQHHYRGAEALYPDALCSLDYEKDYELLFSVRLAAQCTDARVNLVTPALFARYPRWRPLPPPMWTR